MKMGEASEDLLALHALGLDVRDLSEMCEYFDLLAELYGFYNERLTVEYAFRDGIITAEEREYLLDD